MILQIGGSRFTDSSKEESYVAERSVKHGQLSGRKSKKEHPGRLENEPLVLLVLREGHFVEDDAAVAPPLPPAQLGSWKSNDDS